MSFYDIVVKDNKLNDVSLSEYKGKVLLIVNTATKCAFTPQYEDLENLYEKFNGKDFEILDFPCNQFLFQSPGSNNQINEFCQLRFKTKFKRFDKVKVNGKNACDLYKYLKANSIPKENRISWNFNKFLVSKDAKQIFKFGSKVSPLDLSEKINELLNI